MAVDPRQVVAAILTLTMIAMLAKMINKDHFDSVEARHPEPSTVQFSVMKVEEHSLARLPKASKGLWKDQSQKLKPCWTRPGSRLTEEVQKSKGYVTFSLSNGPEYHMSQESDLFPMLLNTN